VQAPSGPPGAPRIPASVVTSANRRNRRLHASSTPQNQLVRMLLASTALQKRAPTD
jgi:hypothetical protein